MKVLLHDCCAPCGAQVVKILKEQGHNLLVYFYNPNIMPTDEYELRLAEMKRFCNKINVPIIVGKNEHEEWLTSVAGFETAPEGGERCEKCFMKRLSEAAQKAQEESCDAFATTLTMSPRKNVKLINKIGQELANFYGLKFIDEVWRDNEGYKKACALSKEEGFHRQNYCGCEFSIRD